MSDEQTTNGGPVVPAPDQAASQAPAPGAPVMDVVPPPQSQAQPVSAPSEGAPVAEAPPEMSDIPPVSDDIAEQIAADSTEPPALEPSVVEATQESSGTSAMAVPPAEEGDPAPDAGDSPSELIASESQPEAATPPPAVPTAPKAHNPHRAAIVGTVFITIALAGLAVFAYISTQQ